MTLSDFVKEGIGLFWGDVPCWCCALMTLVRVNFGYFRVLRLY